MTSLILLRIPATLGARLVEDADAVYQTVTDTAATSRLELGDGWMGMHVLVTAEVAMPRHVALERGLDWDDSSLENALMGGEATPFEDAFTVARYIEPKQVAVIAGKLAVVKRDALAARFDDEVAAVLPATWSDVDAPGARLADGVMSLAAWYRDAAAAGDGMLLYADAE